MGIQERTWINETCDAEVHVCARCCREEVDKSCIHQHEAEQSRSDDKVSHIRSTQERLRDDRIETRLKQNKEVKMQREKKSISSDEVHSQKFLPSKMVCSQSSIPIGRPSGPPSSQAAHNDLPLVLMSQSPCVLHLHRVRPVESGLQLFWQLLPPLHPAWSFLRPLADFQRSQAVLRKVILIGKGRRRTTSPAKDCRRTRSQSTRRNEGIITKTTNKTLTDHAQAMTALSLAWLERCCRVTMRAVRVWFCVDELEEDTAHDGLPSERYHRSCTST